MKYRHAFHAGNFADVTKHVALVAALLRLTEKARALFVLETHAGRGRYAIGGPAPVERRRVDEAPTARRQASRTAEAPVETTSDDCARARVYRDMAADADNPTERDALLRRAQRVCPE